MTVKAKTITECCVIQLYPASRQSVTPSFDTGLVYGIDCHGATTIAWLPIRIPPIRDIRTISACTEFTTTVDDEATCVLRWRYMDNMGNVRELYTRELVAEGETAKVPIPLPHIATDTAFTCALRVEPRSEDNLKRLIPIMIRSAWIEIEHKT